MTAFPASVRAVVKERSGGVCEFCYGPGEGGSIHHRLPRGMGGSSDPSLGGAANALLLCGSGVTGCHGLVESNRVRAMELGLLLSRYGPRPVQAPYRDGFAQWWRLDDDGGKTPVMGVDS